jgi:DNA-binding FadR family transcriptional regulator
MHRQLLSQLIDLITSGEIAEGARLPTEDVLAAQYHASRGVLREALQGLEERGLINVTQGRGAAVTDQQHWNILDPDVLASMLMTPSRAALLSDAAECRCILESEAARLAAQRRTAQQLRAMADELARSVEARGNLFVYQEADVAFHNAVISAASNRVLLRIVAPIQRALSVACAPSARDRAQELDDHARILAGIAKGNADEARLAMRDHLTSPAESQQREARVIAALDRAALAAQRG